ncbi:MAG: transporter associated domain-containing protein, partial [Longimicrobiales bacterium]
AAGDADLREINHFFNTALPQLEHRSLNGYLLEELGRVPDAGETIEREGIRIEVLEASGTQVLRARLRRHHEAPKLLPSDGSGGPPSPPAEIGRTTGSSRARAGGSE